MAVRAGCRRCAEDGRQNKKERLKGENMRKIKIDMWYGDKTEEVDKIDMFFSDIDCIYHGNIYKNGRIIGDYFCSDSTILEKIFPQLIFNWG